MRVWIRIRASWPRQRGRWASRGPITRALAAAALAGATGAPAASAQEWPLYEHEPWERFDLPAETGARCGGETPFRFFFSASKADPETNRVFFWFPGGGSTSQSPSGDLQSPIGSLAEVRNRLTAPGSGPRRLPATGTSPFMAHSANDAFIGSAHWVLLPYCTQDFHSGNRTDLRRYDFSGVRSLVREIERRINDSQGCAMTPQRLESSFPGLEIDGQGTCPSFTVTGSWLNIAQQGARNFELAYPLIKERLARQGVDFSRIEAMIAGSSAGGFATWYNARLVGDDIAGAPRARMTMVPMSGSPNVRVWDEAAGDIVEDRSDGGEVDGARNRLGQHQVTLPCAVDGGAYRVGALARQAGRATKRARRLASRTRRTSGSRVERRARQARREARRARRLAARDGRCLDALDLVWHYEHRWPELDLRIAPVINREDPLGVRGAAGALGDPDYGPKLLRFCRTIHAYGQQARRAGAYPWVAWLWHRVNDVPRRVHGFHRANQLVPLVTPNGRPGSAPGEGTEGLLAYVNAVADRDPQVDRLPPRIDHALALVEDPNDMRTGFDTTFAGEWPILGIDPQECVVAIPLRLAGVAKNPRRGTARLEVDVPAHGKLRLAPTKRVRGSKRTAWPATTVSVPVRPTRRVAKRLRNRGAARVRATVTFTPESGDPSTRVRRLRLVKR